MEIIQQPTYNDYRCIKMEETVKETETATVYWPCNDEWNDETSDIVEVAPAADSCKCEPPEKKDTEDRSKKMLDATYISYNNGTDVDRIVSDYRLWGLQAEALAHEPTRNADRFASLEEAAKTFHEEGQCYPDTESDCCTDWTCGEVQHFLEWLFQPNGDILPWFSAGSLPELVEEMLEMANTLEHGPTLSAPVSIPSLLRYAATMVENAYMKEKDEFENRLLGDVVRARSEERRECADEIEELKDEIGRLERTLKVVLKTVNLRGGSGNILPFEAEELRNMIANALRGDKND